MNVLPANSLSMWIASNAVAALESGEVPSLELVHAAIDGIDAELGARALVRIDPRHVK